MRRTIPLRPLFTSGTCLLECVALSKALPPHTVPVPSGRYVQRRHLDEDHQTTLARWRESSSDKLKALGEVKLTLTHYTESNIGHMDR